MRSSSSDSDAGERVKNVKSILIKSHNERQETDENYAYKQKLGDLIFNANFEAGNLGYVERIDQYNYDLMVRPDVSNPRYRLWFNFTVSNQRPNQGLTPVVRTRLQPNWLRLHEDQVFYYRSIHHEGRYVLSLAFRFLTYGNEHQFALFYPYAYNTLVSFISRWTVELKRLNSTRKQSENWIHNSVEFSHSPLSCRHHPGPDFLHDDHRRTRSSQGFRKSALKSIEFGEDVDFKVSLLGTSILSKSVHLLTIKGTIDSHKSQVIVICRSCGNLDGPASLVCQGLMDYMLSDNLVARMAREYMDLVVLPMVDPDSICVGNSRTDIMGQSIISSKLIQANKSIYSNYARMYNILERICSRETKHRVILIELTVNIKLIGSRMTGTYFEDSLRMERHLCLPRLLARFTNDFYLEYCEFLKPSSASTYLFDFRSEMAIDQYRMEVSPFAFYKRSLMERNYEEYDQQKYLSLGKAMVYSLLELLRSKDKTLPHCVKAILDNFHPKAYDIDDIMLNK